MRTANFKTVLQGAARRAGLDPTTWSDKNAADCLEFFNTWTKTGWEWEFWPEWTVLEQRAYRDEYDPSKAYPAPTLTTPQEVWFPAAQRYYQALQATTGNAPATFTNGEWVANAPFWADSAVGYTFGVPYGQVVPSPYYGSDWAPNTAYTAGPLEIHRNPGDNRFYQCIVTHTSGSTFDPTKWGVLTIFERYVSLDQKGKTPIGEVRQVTRFNPRTSPRYPGPLTFVVNDHGIQPAPLAGVQVWVEFRLRPPQFTLEAWGEGNTYNTGDEVYDDDTGECYSSLIDSNTDNDPSANPAKWQIVAFPALLQEFVKRAVYSDLLRGEGKDAKADTQEEKAFAKLSQASDVALASQAQFDRAQAQTY